MTQSERDRVLRELIRERHELLNSKHLGKPYNKTLLRHLERQIDHHEMIEAAPAFARMRAERREIQALIRKVKHIAKRAGVQL